MVFINLRRTPNNRPSKTDNDVGNSIVSNPPRCGGAVIFGNFLLGGGWEIFGLQGRTGSSRGTPKSRGAEDFDEFYKNVIEKF